jgi:HlyD family secretion protein
MMKRLIPRLLTLLAAAAVVAAFVYAFRPQPVAADFETVTRGPMQVTIDEEGETRLRDRFVVSAPVPGRVLRIDLEPGDAVRAGQTRIATFLPSDPVMLDSRSRAEAEARVEAAENAIGRARAERDRAREELEYAESELERSERLFNQELISRAQYDRAGFDARTRREALSAAEFAVSDAEQAVAVARATLTDTRGDNGAIEPITIRAPIDGVVLRRMRESESVVPAGEPLVELGDVSQLEIVSDFLSEDAVQIDRGDRVLIERWGGGTALEGRVRLIEPSGFTKLSALGVEEQRVNVIIDFVDAAEAARYLGDAYRVEVRVVVWESASAIKAPTGSLFRTGDAWSVFTVAEGMARLRPVDVGQRNGLEAEILSGLSESDTLIIHPSGNIADGVEVVARGTN